MSGFDPGNTTSDDDDNDDNDDDEEDDASLDPASPSCAPYLSRFTSDLGM
jgi:hypothetical protein